MMPTEADMIKMKARIRPYGTPTAVMRRNCLSGFSASDKLLEKPLLKNTKNIRITKIIEFLDKKKALEDTKIAKAAKKMRVGKVVKYGGAVLNALNPVYWFRKLVINTSVDAMTKKVCVVIIGIVGEETVKVYSKKLFDAPVEIDFVEKEMKSLFLEDDVEGELDDE